MSGWDQAGDLEDLADQLHQRGMWNMTCFNGLSQEQQQFLVEKGYLPIGTVPAGDCLRGAECEVTTMWDEYPGPRFYCVPCAIKYLAGMVKP